MPWNKRTPHQPKPWRGGKAPKRPQPNQGPRIVRPPLRLQAAEETARG